MSRYTANQILESPATTSDVFYPRGDFTIQFNNIPNISGGSPNWVLEFRARGHTSASWSRYSADVFTNAHGSDWALIEGLGEAWEVRVRDTATGATNASTTAYWKDRKVVLYQ